MSLNLASFDEGVRMYWAEIGRRSARVQNREYAFTDLAVAYSSRNPPHLNRAELWRIMEWKHTDARWFNRAMEGIDAASDERIVYVTTNIPSDPKLAVQRFNGAFHGVGVASVSAILTAARPDLYAVIDVFALIAVDHHYTFPWIDRMARNKEGQLQPTYSDYPSTSSFVAYAPRSFQMPREQSGRRARLIWGYGALARC